MHCRDHLVKWLKEQLATDNLFRKVLELGAVELLGQFDLLPSSEHKGWIFKLTSKHEKRYLVAVPMDQFRRPTRWFQITYVPWRAWAGPNLDPLVGGDHPGLYKRLAKGANYGQENDRKTDERIPRSFDRIKNCAPIHPPDYRDAGDSQDGQKLDA